MSAVLTDTFLGDIALERIEYLAIVRKRSTTIHTRERSTIVSRNQTLVDSSRLGDTYRTCVSTKMQKRDGVWCSVDSPVGCLALMVVVSE